MESISSYALPLNIWYAPILWCPTIKSNMRQSFEGAVKNRIQ